MSTVKTIIVWITDTKKKPNVLKLREERNETQTKECDWNQATLVVIEWIHSNTHSFIFMILKRKRYSRLLYRYGTRYGVLWVCIGVSILSQRRNFQSATPLLEKQNTPIVSKSSVKFLRPAKLFTFLFRFNLFIFHTKKTQSILFDLRTEKSPPSNVKRARLHWINWIRLWFVWKHLKLIKIKCSVCLAKPTI